MPNENIEQEVGGVGSENPDLKVSVLGPAADEGREMARTDVKSDGRQA